MSGSGDEEPPKNQPSYYNTNSSWTDVEDWINRATKAQNQEYLKNAGRTYNVAKTIDQIETYILTTAFGNNGVKQCCLTVSLKFWYNHVYRSIAAKIRKKMQKHAGSTTVKLNTVFVTALLQDKVKNKETNKEQNAETTVPVFFFEDSLGKLKYIDLFARVYEDWNGYLTSNWIDPALICYPTNGHYAQRQATDQPKFDSNILPDLKIQESPACGALRTVGRWAKKTLAVVTPILTVASVVGVIPGLKSMKYIAKLSPTIQTMNKYYRYVNLASTIVFSIISIGDKVTHDDLDIVAEVTTIVASVLTSLGDDLGKRYLKGKIAAGQEELTAGQTFFFNLFAWSRCAASVVAVLTTLVAMMYKPKCSAMDYFVLASSLYSCYGALTSPKSAQAIFNQVKEDYTRELLIAQKRENDKTKAEHNQSTEKDKANTDADKKPDGPDPSNNNGNEGQKEPSVKRSPNDELIEQRDAMAKTMILDEDDVAGKAAYDYYHKNFVVAFKGTENEYVMNSQLVRMMQNAPNIREMFCEIALTETTLDIRNGILLVNGQLNIDGGALAHVHNNANTDVAERLRLKIQGADRMTYQSGNKGDRETLFEETKDYNNTYENLRPDQRDQADVNFLKRPNLQRFTANKGSYRLFFESNARNFDRQFFRDMEKPLEAYEIGGEKVFQNMSTADKQRLQQQLFKHSIWVTDTATGQKEQRFRPELFDAAVALANKTGSVSAKDLASCIGIVEYESRTMSGVTEEDSRQVAAQKKNQFLNDVANDRSDRLQKILDNINELMPKIEESLETTGKHLGFHNPFEAYEHVLQHRPKSANPLDSDQRLADARKYLSGTGPPPNPQPRWNQWGTKLR